MNKISLFFRSLFLALPLLAFFSCNDSPTIIFTSPQKGEEYFRDIDIKVDVIITDTKGKTLTVQLYVDDIQFDELLKPPYFFTIKGGALPPGPHMLKIKAKDVEARRIITVKEAASESSDFVTFTDGIIPPEWSVKNWSIYYDGVDDRFSIAAITTDSALVSTSKTCNNISFYLKGVGTLYLYMDNKNQAWQVIEMGIEDTTAQGWTLYNFSCTKTYHTFTWKFYDIFPHSASLDAIRFEK